MLQIRKKLCSSETIEYSFDLNTHFAYFPKMVQDMNDSLLVNEILTCNNDNNKLQIFVNFAVLTQC